MRHGAGQKFTHEDAITACQQFILRFGTLTNCTGNPTASTTCCAGMILPLPHLYHLNNVS
jgi:hypothetical protein